MAETPPPADVLLELAPPPGSTAVLTEVAPPPGAFAVVELAPPEEVLVELGVEPPLALSIVDELVPPLVGSSTEAVPPSELCSELVADFESFPPTPFALVFWTEPPLAVEAFEFCAAPPTPCSESLLEFPELAPPTPDAESVFVASLPHAASSSAAIAKRAVLARLFM